MARSIKRGIDYFSLDVGIFADRKIRRVCHSHGSSAMAVVLRALCCIYGENGYYADADNDFFFDIAHELSLEEANVRDVISACAAAGFFDAALLDTHGILTSRRIQRNYLDATKRRDNAEIEPAYCLLKDDSPSLDGINVCNNADNACNNAQNVCSGTQSKVNQMKGEERKGEVSISNNGAGRLAAAAPDGASADTPDIHTTSLFSPFIKPSLDEVKAYCDERGSSVDPRRFVDFYDSKGWMVGSSPMRDWQACVRKWETDTYNLPGMPVHLAAAEEEKIEYKYSIVI